HADGDAVARRRRAAEGAGSARGRASAAVDPLFAVCSRPRAHAAHGREGVDDRGARSLSELTLRFGVLGDVHCEDEALAAALQLFREQRVDRILSVGDLVDGQGDASKTLELVMPHVEAVAGNHDRWMSKGPARGVFDATPMSALSPEQHRWLAALPD